MNYVQILDNIVADERYQRNILWGKPRKGHPEGTIKAHIAELETNLATLSDKLSETELAKIRILIHTHDTFKGEARTGVAVINYHSHASHARRFLAEYCNESDLLNMVQFHDEHYAIFRKIKPDGTCDSQRLLDLFTKIRDWDIFLAFIIVDGCTVGKSSKPVEWLMSQSLGMIQTRIDESWIIRHG